MMYGGNLRQEPYIPHFFEELSQSERTSFVEGPAIILVVTHRGEPLEYLHQVSAADGLVRSFRYCQMVEQRSSNHRPFLIEFPRNALVEASPRARHYLEEHPDETRIPLDMGHILPGYAMEVLDWYANALNSRIWHNFPVDGGKDILGSPNKWLYYYIYVTMRVLGMDMFAGIMQNWLEHHMRTFAADYGGHVHILRHLPVDDPLVRDLAGRLVMAQEYAQRSGKLSWLPMSEGALKKIKGRWPHFAELIKQLSAPVPRRERMSDHWTIVDHATEMDVEDMRSQMTQDEDSEGTQGDDVSDAVDHMHIAS